MRTALIRETRAVAASARHASSNAVKYAINRLLEKGFVPLDDVAARAADDATTSDPCCAETLAPHIAAATVAVVETDAASLESLAASERLGASITIPPPSRRPWREANAGSRPRQTSPMKTLIASMLHVDDHIAENTAPKVEWCTRIRLTIRGTSPAGAGLMLALIWLLLAARKP
jgi:hypothetical protein